MVWHLSGQLASQSTPISQQYRSLLGLVVGWNMTHKFVRHLIKLTKFDNLILLHQFECCSSGRDKNLSLECDDNDNDDSVSHQTNQTSDLLVNINSVLALEGSQWCIVNYFEQASDLRQVKHPQVPCPFHTFTMALTAFQLPQDPQLKKISIDISSKQFDLPDLCPALAEYFHRSSSNNIDLYLVPIGVPLSPSSSYSLLIDAKCEQQFEFKSNNIINYQSPSKKWQGNKYSHSQHGSE